MHRPSTFFRIVAASFARLANTTAYAVGDLVANAIAANAVVPAALPAARILGGRGTIERVRLVKSGVTLTDAAFRVHLFTLAPTPTGGDNDPFGVTNGRAKGYLGRVDVTCDQAIGDGAFGAATSKIMFQAADNTLPIFALVEARGAYVPASGETFKIELEVSSH